MPSRRNSFVHLKKKLQKFSKRQRQQHKETREPKQDDRRRINPQITAGRLGRK